MDITEREEKILNFWKKNKIFEKSVETPAGKKPRGNYIFYDGPPFITGLPHYATLLPSIVKDCIPRFWTMKGFRVERVWGWDCHGLPAENKVEKQLNLKNKKDIETFGVGKFVAECKSYVNNVSSQWQWYIDKIARWVDMKNAYKTMDINFMESVIWGFKQLFDKGLVYEGYRTSLHCPRCATPLSKFEITMDAGSYKDITEMSVVVKFKLQDQNSSVLAWTTTPWTLPGNLALAVNKDLIYVELEYESEKLILAKERLKEIFNEKKLKVIREFKGSELIGKKYIPLFELKNKELSENQNTYRIYEADFVTIEEGTGIVHIAPNFGEDDFELGKKANIPILDLMDESGVYTEQTGPFKNLYFKDAGKKVMKSLGKKIFSKFNCTHSYPFCYRCETPLIYKTQKAWYLDIDKIRDNMLKTNEKINWIPSYFKHGRFKHNLETAPHWCLSRSRYWGSPIPIWRCKSCDKLKVPGSIKEIEDLSGKPVKDLHKPAIDKHVFKCESCGSLMQRVPEVLDCWFESGSMSYAQWHYPFERGNEFEKIFPADFIVEYTGQLRGWFYTLHAVSNALFNSESFKNVIVTGVLAGTDGRKMSKSFGNYPDPKSTLEKYGGDAIRMYFLTNPIITGGDMKLNEKDIQDSMRKNIMLLLNILNFYLESSTSIPKNKKSEIPIDRWITSKIHELNKAITENLESYDLPSASRPITSFIENLSWYVRLNRDRLNSKDEKAIYTLYNVLERLSKITAPFTPYTSEYIWQKITKNNFKKSESVHLQEWINPEEKKIDQSLIDEIVLVREIISTGLREREKVGISLKWPLESAEVMDNPNSFFISVKSLKKEFQEIIKSQLNIKNISFRTTTKRLKNTLEVKLDTNLTPELEAEGYARELSRKVQAFRKKLGLKKEDKIRLYISTSEDIKEIFLKNKKFIEERTNSNKLEFLDVTTGKERFKNKTDFNIKRAKGVIGIVTDE